MENNKNIWKDFLVDKPTDTEQKLVLTSCGKVKTAYFDVFRSQWYINLGMPGEVVEKWASEKDLLSVG